MRINCNHIINLKLTDMKKILLFMAVLAVAMCMVSCDSFEDKAKKQMYKTMRELAKDEESLKISQVKVCISNDSLCVIHFIAKARNGFGGYSVGSYEYVYVKDIEKDICYENIKELETPKDRKYSLERTYKDLIDGTDEITKEARDEVIKKGESVQNAALKFTYDMALIGCKYDGREIEKE